MPFADLDAVRLFYTDEGTGEPVLLFVHGFSCDSHDWSWQLAHFTEAHRVVAVDLRGHGRSSAPATGYTHLDHVVDLVGLLDELALDQVVAIGHSMGGAVVSALAVEHPQRVQAVVAVDPAYLLPDASAEHLGPVLDALAASDPVPIVQQVLGAQPEPALDPALRTWHLRRVAGVAPHVLREAFTSSVRGLTLHANSASYLGRRTCPVLTVYADPGRCPVEEAVFTDARSRTVGWEGAGHWLQQERPDDFNALVEEWLASL